MGRKTYIAFGEENIGLVEQEHASPFMSESEVAHQIPLHVGRIIANVAWFIGQVINIRCPGGFIEGRVR